MNHVFSTLRQEKSYYNLLQKNRVSKNDTLKFRSVQCYVIPYILQIYKFCLLFLASVPYGHGLFPTLTLVYYLPRWLLPYQNPASTTLLLSRVYHISSCKTNYLVVCRSKKWILFYQNWQNFLRYVILRLFRAKYNLYLSMGFWMLPAFESLFSLSLCTFRHVQPFYLFLRFTFVCHPFELVCKWSLIDWFLKTTDNSMWFVFYISLLTCFKYIMHLLDLSSFYLIIFLICF